MYNSYVTIFLYLITLYVRMYVDICRYVPSKLIFLLLLQHLVIPLYNHHNNTDVPHVYIPSTKIEIFVILWYLSKRHTNILLSITS